MHERIRVLAEQALREDLFPPYTPVSCEGYDANDPMDIARYIRTYLLAQHSLVRKDEMLAGTFRYTGVIPCDHTEHENGVDSEMVIPTDCYHKIGHTHIAKFFRPHSDYNPDASPICFLDWDHYCTNYPFIINQGMQGYVKRIERAKIVHQHDDKKLRYLDALAYTVESIRLYLMQTANEYRMGDRPDLADLLDRVPWNAPQNFKEAFQAYWIAWLFLPDSLGRIDQILFPFYDRDIKNGLLTEETAREMVAEFLIKVFSARPGGGFTDHRSADNTFSLGGYAADGHDGFNKLSEIFAETLAELPIRRLRDNGISCIYISHKLDEIFKLCDRTIVFRDGQKISEHEKNDGYNSKQVIEDMIGRRLDNMYPVRSVKIGEEIMRAEHFCVAHPFSYGKNIIEDVSITLYKGEILGLAGLVGAGRSELVEAIFAAREKRAGDLYIDGKHVTLTEPKQAIETGIGFLSEDRKKNGFVWSMDILKNMTLASFRDYVRGCFINDSLEEERATEYFNKLKVKAPGLDTMITNLSGGNQQKVILAKWLMTKIKVLILDEPTRGIDVGTKAEIYNLMQELTDTGIAIIMISSEMPELLAMCDRIVVLGKGVVQAEFLRNEVDEVKLMQAASCT